MATTATPASAVISSASAVDTDAAEPIGNFLPNDRHYRMTGEMPAAESTESTEGDGKEAGAGEGGESGKEKTASGDDNAAASREAASGQKTATQKTDQTSENRYAKLSRENREMREKLARLEGREEGRAASRDSQQTSQSAADKTAAPKPEPKIDDVDPKTGIPTYKTLQDWLNARDEWREAKLLEKVRAENAKTEQQRTAEQQKRVIEAEVGKRVQAAKKAHADYDDVITQAAGQKDEHGQDAFFYTEGSPIDAFFLESDLGHELMYHIAKNLDQHKAIFARDKQGRYLMNPVRQVRELTKIEVALASKSSSSKTAAAGSGKSGEPGAAGSSSKPVSQAPRPAHQTSGQGSVGKDAIEQAVEDGDVDTYTREQNARDLARRKRGK